MSSSTDTPPMGCPKCPYDHDPRKCTAHRSSARDEDGNLLPCGSWRVGGATVCLAHGAHASQVKAKARRNVAEAQARGEFGRLVDQCGLEVKGRSIAEVLEDVIERAGAMALAWFQIVVELDRDSQWTFDHVKGPQGSVQRWVAVTVDGLIGPNHQGEQRVHVAAEQYRVWLDTYLKAAKVAADLGLAERKQRMEEAFAVSVQAAMLAALAELGVDSVAAGPVVARHLRAVG